MTDSLTFSEGQGIFRPAHAERRGLMGGLGGQKLPETEEPPKPPPQLEPEPETEEPPKPPPQVEPEPETKDQPEPEEREPRAK